MLKRSILAFYTSESSLTPYSYPGQSKMSHVGRLPLLEEFPARLLELISHLNKRSPRNKKTVNVGLDVVDVVHYKAVFFLFEMWIFQLEIP